MIMEKASWYTINNAAEIDSPALIVYPDRVKSNITLLKTFVSHDDRRSRQQQRLLLDSSVEWMPKPLFE